MTPPTSNDATHVIGDGRRHHEKHDIVGNVDVPKNKTSGNVVGVHGTNEPHRHEGVVNKVEGAAGNVVGKVEGTTERLTGMHHDGRDRHGLNNDVDKTGKCGTHGLNNDVGCTDKHDAKYTGYDNRIGQQTGAGPQRTNLVPPPPQQQLDNKLTGNNERSANDVGNNAFTNARRVEASVEAQARSGNPVPPPSGNARRGDAAFAVDLSHAGPVNPDLPELTNPNLSKPSATNRTDEAKRF
ncbi:hypothetical protein GGI09_003602 [Coemansia sp. S100]|nr:hypothetical protein GGI09_003602 [Coemansia sp. S100]